MKRVIAAVGALTLLSVGAANAALATYDFNNATTGTVTMGSGDTNFDGGLAALGITSSTIAGASAGGGVIDSTPFAPLPGGIAANVYTTGFNGTWTLLFGTMGTNSFAFNYWDTNSGAGNGLTATAYDLSNNQIGQFIIDPGVSGALNSDTVTFSGLGVIGRITIADRSTVQGGDNVFIDGLVADPVVPEPSTYFMIGSALAGLAVYRRRRA